MLGRDVVDAEGVNDLRPIEQTGALLGRLEPVHDVVVGEDLLEWAPARVLAEHVLGYLLLARRALEQEGEEIPEHRRRDCILSV